MNNEHIQQSSRLSGMSGIRTAMPPRLRGVVWPSILTASLTLSNSVIGQSLFTEVSESAGIDFVHDYSGSAVHFRFMAPGAAVGDYDGDGWLDLYVCNGWGYANSLYHNQGDGTFVDVAADGEEQLGADLAMTDRESKSALFVDYDGDGWLDLFVANEGDAVDPPPPTVRHNLFRNLGNGRFDDVTDSVGPFTHPYREAEQYGYTVVSGLAAGDLTGDGYPEIYIAYWVDTDQLFLNHGGQSFTDISTAAGIDLAGKDSFTPQIWDADGDGLFDIHVTVDLTEDLMFMNQGGDPPTFVDVAAEAGLDSIFNEMGSTLVDYDRDGDLDMFFTNIEEPDEWVGLPDPPPATKWNRFYRNDSAEGVLAFADVGPDLEVHRTGWGWGVTFMDYNHDGWQDLFVVNGNPGPRVEFHDDPSRAFRNDGGTFTDVSAELGFNDTRIARALIAFDYDNDGDQDLFVTNYLESALLYRNDVGSVAGNWVIVDPVGLLPNREAVESTVFVTTGDVEQMRFITAGTSFISQESSEAHFGIGSADRIDSIRVIWPDGSEDVLNDQEVNSRIAVRQGAVDLTISGPAAVGVGYDFSYTASLNFTDGSSWDVTDAAVWSLEATPYAELTGPGLLSVFDMEPEEAASVSVQARFEQWTASESVEIVLSTAPDAATPVVEITVPAVSGPDSPFVTTEDTIELEGTAQDDGGVLAIVWSNDRGGSGPCSGVSSWTTGPIALSAGDNLVTISARDALMHEGTARLTVRYGAEGDEEPDPPPTEPVEEADDGEMVNGNASADDGDDAVATPPPPSMDSSGGMTADGNENDNAPVATEDGSATSASSGGGRSSASGCGSLGLVGVAWSVAALVFLRRRA